MDIFERQETTETIRTIIKARWFYVSLIFLQGLLIKFVLRSHVPLASSPILSFIVAGVFLFNFGYWLYVRRPVEKINTRGLLLVKILQVPIDQLAVSAVLYFSGTTEKLIILIYIVTLLIASSLYRWKGVALATLTSIIFFGSLAYFEYQGIMRPISAGNSIFLRFVQGDRIWLRGQLIGFISYSVSAAIVAGLLAGLFRRREKRLKEQKNELMQKTEVITEKAQEVAKTRNLLREALLKSDKTRLELAAVVRSLNDGLIMLSQKGIITMLNDQAASLFLIKKEAALGQKIEVIKNPLIGKIINAFESGTGPLNKKEIVLSEKPERAMEASVVSVVDENQQLLGRLFILHDISREKAIERMKSEFVSIAAHQLRTPLSAIKWTLRLVLDHDLGPISSQQAEILQKGYQSNERMINLVNDLLNVARIEEGKFIYKFTPVQFVDLIKEVIGGLEPFIKIKNITIKLDAPSKAKIVVMADEEKMKLAVQNLVENAINYSPLASLVTIVVKCDKMNLTLEVADKGMGVPKDQTNRVFSKFFRGDNAVRMETEGTGLGLFIVKNIIESHGGRVWFKSEEGKGSTFYFSLPLKK